MVAEGGQCGGRSSGGRWISSSLDPRLVTRVRLRSRPEASLLSAVLRFAARSTRLRQMLLRMLLRAPDKQGFDECW